MNFSDIPITALIPQRPPFVMVDRVVSFDNADAVTEFCIREDNIFLDDGHLLATGIIENMAQSCAARMGCINSMHNDAIKIGFIGDIRNCIIERRPLLGETLMTQVHIVEEVFNLTLATVTTKVGDEEIASARVKIALTDIVSSETPTD